MVLIFGKARLLGLTSQMKMSEPRYSLQAAIILTSCGLRKYIRLKETPYG